MQIRTNPRRHEIRGREKLDTVQERALKEAAAKQAAAKAEAEKKAKIEETTSEAPVKPEPKPAHGRQYRLFDRHSGQINNKTARKSGAGKGGWGTLTDTIDDDTYYQEFYGAHRPFQHMQVCRTRRASLTLDEYFKARGMSFTDAHEARAIHEDKSMKRRCGQSPRRRSSRARSSSRTTLMVQSAGRSPTTEGGQRDTGLPWMNGKETKIEWGEHEWEVPPFSLKQSDSQTVFPPLPTKVPAEPWHGGTLEQRQLEKMEA